MSFVSQSLLIDRDIGEYETRGLRDNPERLRTTILWDYEYQFMGNRHAMDGKLQTQVFYLNKIP